MRLYDEVSPLSAHADVPAVAAPGRGPDEYGSWNYLPSFAAACARRATLRFAALRWITPFCAARMISGSEA
jgi:hypothetical protein